MPVRVVVVVVVVVLVVVVVVVTPALGVCRRKDTSYRDVKITFVCKANQFVSAVYKVQKTLLHHPGIIGSTD
jgi:hypothetical protein